METNQFEVPGSLPYYVVETEEKLGQAFLCNLYRHRAVLRRTRVFVGLLLLNERHAEY